jgi:citronellol/citronellal dehydrogenase
MNGINTRGTFLVGRTCIPYLKKSANPHILTLSPPLDLRPEWFGAHLAYTIAKYGMSLCTLGWADEFRKDGIAANSLWPRTLIATAAINLLGGDSLVKKARGPSIMADAAHAILTKPSREFTGRFCIDDEVLRDIGVHDLTHYAAVPGTAEADLQTDLFVA